MIIRGVPHDPIAISQPTHAWVSGQLARAWGNERFGPVEPWEDVCLGAEQHDLGWTEWERRPTLNPATGLPRRFFELPTGEHVALWHDASQRMLTQSRYAALLVSLHISTLYERHNYVNDSPTAAENVAVAVTPLSATGERWAIDPWPFREATVSLRYEGRRVPKVPTEDEPAWQLAYAAAQWVSVDVELADR